MTSCSDHRPNSFDLRDVRFVDSSGVNAILIARARARDDGVDLALHAPRAEVLRVFERLGLDDILS